MAESAGALVVRENRALSADLSGSTLTGAQLKFISTTDFVPAGLRGNMPAIAACVATGRALGLPDMTALRSIHIIEGKATFSAELMVMLARKAGHSIVGEVGPDAAKVTGKRVDNGDTMSVEFTLEMAQRIGLLGKSNWKKYPEAMLWARAVSQLCRMLFADCFAGASYTPEELGAGDITADELMDEPAAADGAGDNAPDAAAEVIAVEDEPVVDEKQTPEQKDQLLALFSKLADVRSDTDWGGTLTTKIKQDYNAENYNDLTGPQMAELLSWLEGELPKPRRRAAA